MYLVDDDEAIGMLRKIEFRFGESGKVRWGFQIKINTGPSVGNQPRQSCFAALTGTDESYGRVTVQQSFQ